MTATTPTHFAEPRVGVQLGHITQVFLWDAAIHPDVGVDAAGLEASKDGFTEGVALLMRHRLDGLANLSLDPLLMPSDGAASFASTYDDSERWYTYDLFVDASRTGDLLTFATAIVPSATYPSGSPIDDENRIHLVSCDAGALERALPAARRWLERAAEIVSCAPDAPADAPWADWAAHPCLEVRRRVVKAKNLPAEVLEVLAREPELTYDVVMRRDTPAHVLAAVYADHGVTSATDHRLADHPNTPTHVLEEIERLGAGRSQYTTAHKASVRARARLAERALAESGDLEGAFGELRAALDATPSADAWRMLLRMLRAALAVDPEQVAEVWVPYARERMDAWRTSDCALPDAEVDAWIAGARPSPLLGVCKKLSINASDEEPDEAAWGRLVDSPFTAGLVNLTYLRCPTRAALDALARIDLPAIQEIYAIGFGQEGAPIDHDPVELLSASWLPRLREFMLSHARTSTSTMTEFVSRTPLLTWLTLNHGALDGAFARALDASGAARQLRHLDLDDGDYAEAVAGLRDLELPALIHLSAGGAGLTQAHLESICASPWLGRLGDLHLDRNPGIVDLSPLIEVVATLRPTITLRLEGHGAPPDQVEALEAALPETAWLDVG